MLWRLSIVLFGFAIICAGALSALTLWVLFGFPLEPRKSDADTLGSRFEARKSQSLEGVGPLKLTGAAPLDRGQQPGPRGRSQAEATNPSIASSRALPAAQAAQSDDRSFRGSGSSSAPAAEPANAAKQTQTKAGAGSDEPQLARTEPQDRRPAIRRQENSGALTDLRPRMQCSVDLCAATYRSFHAADCTYQPHGGGPRTLCELGARPPDVRPQTPRASTDPKSEAQDAQVAEAAAEVPKAGTPARAGAQCNLNLCAATYASFHAADCTYQPYDGGPRRICER